MKIRKLELIEGARIAAGQVVIIDVFRAFSTTAYVLAGGVREIFAVGSLRQAYALKEQNPGFVLYSAARPPDGYTGGDGQPGPCAQRRGPALCGISGQSS